MDYRENIQNAVEYIEANLSEQMTIADLARAAGYSEYHFLRIFKEAVKLTPADYIRKRRLTEIACEMMDSSRPASDIAFAYGFQSKENFTRAFKAEHNILPSEFRACKNSLKLYEPICFKRKPVRPEAELVCLQPFRLVAYPCDQDLPARFWNEYNAKKMSARLSGSKSVEDFGVSHWNPDRNRLDYYIGIPETEAAGDLTGTVRLDIPGGLYAMFRTPPSTHAGFVNTIHQFWAAIADVWLPENGYVRTGGYEFECYVEASRTFSEKIYVPIQRKQPWPEPSV